MIFIKSFLLYLVYAAVLAALGFVFLVPFLSPHEGYIPYEYGLWIVLAVYAVVLLLPIFLVKLTWKYFRKN